MADAEIIQNDPNNGHKGRNPMDIPFAVIVILVISFLFLYPVSLDFTNLDEGYYASVSYNMAKSGDWLTPQFNGAPWWEKPPMLYWAMAGSFKLFGFSEGAGRLPSALAIIFTAFTILIFAMRRFKKRVGIGAFFVFVSSIFVFIQSRLATTDGLLLLFLTLMFFLFWEFTIEGKRWALVTALIACGLATLTKGPVAIFFLIATAILTAIFIPESRKHLKDWKAWLIGLVLMLAIVIPWYAMVWQKYGWDSFSEFIIRQNLGRFSGGDKAHALPFYMTFVFLILGFFPWAFYLIPAAAHLRGNSLFKYLWIWFLLIFVFFTISGTKLPNYLLPLYPAAAILTALIWSKKEYFKSKSALTANLLTAFLCSAVAIALFISVPYINKQFHINHFFANAIFITLSLVLFIAIILMKLYMKQKYINKYMIYIGSIFIISMFYRYIIDIVPDYNKVTWKPVHSFAEKVRPELPTAKLVLYKMHPSFPSVNYYARNPFIETDDPEEIGKLTGTVYVITTNEQTGQLSQFNPVTQETKEKWSLVKIQR